MKGKTRITVLEINVNPVEMNDKPPVTIPLAYEKLPGWALDSELRISSRYERDLPGTVRVVAQRQASRRQQALRLRR
jgi:hypothetical protein